MTELSIDSLVGGKQCLERLSTFQRHRRFPASPERRNAIRPGMKHYNRTIRSDWFGQHLVSSIEEV